MPAPQVHIGFAYTEVVVERGQQRQHFLEIFI
jgi:hypothetical protein